ncbi:MAG: GntR family transcriptional regulator [Spirochaetota bacterium]
MRNNKQIRYLTIAERLRKKIRSGDLTPGASLPSQKELAAIFDTTVMTVRQALAVLEHEGLINFTHGVGTFVATGEMKGRDIRLVGFADEMKLHKVQITTKIVEKNFSHKDERIQKILGISEKRFCRLTRLRFINQDPIILQRSYVAAKYQSVIKEYNESESLYACLHKVSGELTTGREIISSILPSPIEAGLLNIRPDRPILLSYRVSLNIAHRVILFDEAYISGKRVVAVVRQIGKQHFFNYNVVLDDRADLLTQLLNPDFWEES